MEKDTARVLDVGQCQPDHMAIRLVIQNNFHAKVERAMSADQAVERLADGAYDLVLVNRVIDADGSDGSALITRMKAEAKTKSIPVMLISNYADAQEAAVAAGAEPGFGKAQLHEAQTIERLAKFLPRK